MRHSLVLAVLILIAGAGGQEGRAQDVARGDDEIRVHELEVGERIWVGGVPFEDRFGFVRRATSESLEYRRDDGSVAALAVEEISRLRVQRGQRSFRTVALVIGGVAGCVFAASAMSGGSDVAQCSAGGTAGGLLAYLAGDFATPRWLDVALGADPGTIELGVRLPR